MYNLHGEQYQIEREKRWKMAEKGEDSAIRAIIDIIKKKGGDDIRKIEYERYDEFWFSKKDINDKDNEWVKGCPDYKVTITLTENRILLFEIKLKAQEFRKTQTGGKTQQGSLITKYGCPSYYLDIEPVYRNMNDFCENIKLDSKNFIIAFISENMSEIRLITLYKINHIIEYGWNKIPICTFGEGYGQNTYLIPKNATSDINNLSWDNILSVSMIEIEY